MNRSAVEITSPEYDEFKKGKPTPGTHTAVKEVPLDEIETIDGKLNKGGKIIEEKSELTEKEALWKKAFDLKTEGKSWSVIAAEMGIAKNQTWLFVGKHCARIGIENPFSKGKSRKKATAPAPKQPEPATSPQVSKDPEKPVENVSEPVLEPIQATSTRIIQEGDKDFRKQTSNHKFTAIVNRDGQEFVFNFDSKPRDRDIDRAIRAQLQFR